MKLSISASDRMSANGAVLQPRRGSNLARGTEKEHAMSQKSSSAIAVVGIDIEDWIFLQHGPLSAIDRDT